MGLACLGVPGGSEVLAGGFCTVYFRWNVERRCRIGPGSEPNYRECQGKNARQSHPENPFKKMDIVPCVCPAEAHFLPKTYLLSHALWWRVREQCHSGALLLLTTSTIPEKTGKPLM